MTVVVAHPARLSAFAGGTWRWVYADGDATVYAELAARLGPSHRLVSPAAFQEAVVALRGRFVAWVDHHLVGATPEERLLTPFDRSPFTSDLFLHVAWLAVLSRALRETTLDVLVITASRGCATALAMLCRQLGVAHRCAGRLRLGAVQGAHSLLAVARCAREGARLLVRMLVARSVLRQSRWPAVDVLVETYLHDGDISENGAVRERYTPGLLAWYRKQGVAAGLYPFLHDVPLRRLLATYRGMRAAEIPIVPFERVAVIADLWRAWRRVWQPLDRRAVAPFDGVDVTPLIAERRRPAALAALTCLVLLQAPRRLAAAGIRPRTLIDWFENQPINTATVAGFRRALPDCVVVGLRQYLLYPNWLSMFTTSREADSGVVPREQWVCGRGQQPLAATYDGVTTYRVVPALRYAHLYRNGGATTSSGRDVLILLTHSMEESASILRCVLDAGVDGTLTVKAHPDLDLEVLRRGCSQRPRAAVLIWSDASLDALFKAADIVVTGGTSAAVEAVCRGLPVVMIGQAANIDINPLETVDPRLWQTVYDATGLAAALRRWLPHPLTLTERLTIGQRVRDEMFEPVSDRSMRALLPGAATPVPVPSRAAHEA